MNRRLTVGAIVLALSAPQAATATTVSAPQQPGVRAERGTDAEEALGRLRSDADGKLRVHRAADGVVDFVSSTDGKAMVEARGTKGPSRTATDQLARYGKAFGIDGSKSRAVVKRTSDSATGGSIVRADQVVAGVPVFGGQVVMSLDEDQGVVSVDAATTAATVVAAPVVSEAQASRNAVATIAKSHRIPASKLSVTDRGRRVYDPAIVHTVDPRGTRPVWEFEVTNGSDVRETVLVGTSRGEIALHFNDAPGINRVVCDNANDDSTFTDEDVPQCTTPARAEGGDPHSENDVNAAYDNLGATSDTYEALGVPDLTSLIGTGAPKQLMATVRWCFGDEDCPFPNAFWDGTQMVFGAGYAGADDVVAHELTHGYVERTSALFMLHQSGALNESLADVVGEVVDHRNNPTLGEDDTEWNLGEDIPGGAIRSLKDPTLHGQPDRMASSLYQTADVYEDGGAVHHNNGVGNKTAYLISQGGTFNGRTVAGIDGGDTGLAKTGRLYLDVIARLTSGAEYADLGRVLASTCDEFVASRPAEYTAADCTSVRDAVLATELAQAPADPEAAASEAAASCPSGYTYSAGRRDNDTTDEFGWTFGGLWQRTPANDAPTYARGGTSSLFAWNPDPELGTPPSSDASSSSLLVADGGVRTYLHFHHAYLFEFIPADGAGPAVYYDGAQVLIQSLDPTSGAWTTRTGLPWVNGPTSELESSAVAGFGGDSHGYGSSRVDLTSLGGQQARVVLRVVGDETVSFLGWWVDDLQIFNCSPLLPSAPTRLTVRAGYSTAAVSWAAPANPGSGVTRYIVTHNPGDSRIVSANTRSAIIRQPLASHPAYIGVSASSAGGDGPTVRARIGASHSYSSASKGRVRRGRYFTVSVKVIEGIRGIRGMPVLLQSRTSTTRPWRNVAAGTTSSTGVKAWRVRQARATYYRMVSRGFSTWFGSASGSLRIRMR